MINSHIDISDFLPDYQFPLNHPLSSLNITNDKNLAQYIYSKKEFNELSESIKSSFLPHQEFVARYISPHTPYDRLLVFHGLGTGKTSAAILSSEITLKNSSFNKKILVLVKGENIASNFIKEVMDRVGEKYKGNIYDIDFNDKKSLEKLTKRTKRNIKNKYEIVHFESFSRSIQLLSPDQIKLLYSNRLIIIDEVQNLQQNNHDGRYDSVLKLLNNIDNSKLLLLSATPWSSVDQFISTINLLLAPSQKLSYKDNNIFLNSNTKLSTNDLKNLLSDKISFIKSEIDNILVKHIGIIFNSPINIFNKTLDYTMKYFHLDFHSMSKSQSDLYLSQSNDSMYIKQRKVSLSLPKDKIVDITHVDDYSCIYSSILKNILANPTKKIFVYCEYIENVGIDLFINILKNSKFSDTPSKNLDSLEKGKKRFIVLTGTTKNNSSKLKFFNSSKNNHGEFIQVVIGSIAVSEGISFKCVRQVHIATPSWYNSDIEQVIGRAVRFKSHDELPLDERSVDVFRHVAIPVNEKNERLYDQSVDLLMYATSEYRDVNVKPYERLCMEAAIDCSLNKKRNVLDPKFNESRLCEYTKCDYSCFNDPTKYNDLLYNTYNLYYAEQILHDIIIELKLLFSKKFSYNIYYLYSHHFSNYSIFILFRAIKTILDQFIILKNPYGFDSYLKKDHDLLFLTDQLQLPNDFTISFYTQFPFVFEYHKNFDKVIDTFQNKEIFNLLTKHDNLFYRHINENNTKLAKDDLSFLYFENLQTLIINSLILTINKSPGNVNQQTLRKFFTEAYSNRIKKRNDGSFIIDNEITISSLGIRGKEKIIINKFSIIKSLEENRNLSFYGIIDLSNEFKIKTKTDIDTWPINKQTKQINKKSLNLGINCMSIKQEQRNKYFEEIQSSFKNDYNDIINNYGNKKLTNESKCTIIHHILQKNNLIVSVSKDILKIYLVILWKQFMKQSLSPNEIKVINGIDLTDSERNSLLS